MSCIGMEYLHQKKMMHRDLKSSNGILYSNLCTKTFRNTLAYKTLNLGMIAILTKVILINYG